MTQNRNGNGLTGKAFFHFAFFGLIPFTLVFNFYIIAHRYVGTQEKKKGIKKNRNYDAMI